MVQNTTYTFPYETTNKRLNMKAAIHVPDEACLESVYSSPASLGNVLQTNIWLTQVNSESPFMAERTGEDLMKEK